MCLGANKIYMTRQSTLGPIDPSINSPLSPEVSIRPGQVVKIPTSVESVKGYFDLAKKELSINRQQELIQPFMKLSDKLHPLLLGDVYRRKSQIKMIASKLLGDRISPKKTKNAIVDFLCGDSGSHDYTISYTEAKQLGLNVELLDKDLNNLITEWYNQITSEMLLRKNYDPVLELAKLDKIEYKYIRAVIDSILFGRHNFVSEGTLTKIVLPTGVPNQQINDIRVFEGWKEDVSK